MGKKPCQCPNCNGALREAITVRRHKAKQIAIEAYYLDRQRRHQQLYEAMLENLRRGQSEPSELSGDDDPVSEEGSDSDSDSYLELVKPPVKRRRLDDNKNVSPDNQCEEDNRLAHDSRSGMSIPTRQVEIPSAVTTDTQGTSTTAAAAPKKKGKNFKAHGTQERFCDSTEPVCD